MSYIIHDRWTGFFFLRRISRRVYEWTGDVDKAFRFTKQDDARRQAKETLQWNDTDRREARRLRVQRATSTAAQRPKNFSELRLRIENEKPVSAGLGMHPTEASR